MTYPRTLLTREWFDANVHDIFFLQGAAGKSELPKLFAEGVISVHKQFTDLIQKAFADNSHFVTALDMANEQYINRNPVTVMQAAQNQQVLNYIQIFNGNRILETSWLNG